MTDESPRTVRFLLAAILGFAALFVAYQVRDVLTPLAFGLILAYVLNPFVSWLERNRVHRVFGTLIVFAILILAIGGAIRVGVPPAMEHAEKFFDRAEVAAQRWLERQVGEERAVELIRNARAELKEYGTSLANPSRAASTFVGGALVSGVAGLFSLFSYLVLVPVVAFFALVKMDALWKRVRDAMPSERVLAALDRIHRANAAFFRGQLSICLIKGAIGAVAFNLVGLPGFVLGFVYALASIFPFLGVLFMFGLVTLLSLAESGPPVDLVKSLGALAAIEALEGFVLQPMILGKGTGLHPALVLVSFMIWGKLLGLFGLLIAVPLTSAAKIVLDEFVFPLWRDVGKDVTKEIPKPTG